MDNVVKVLQQMTALVVKQQEQIDILIEKVKQLESKIN